MIDLPLLCVRIRAGDQQAAEQLVMLLANLRRSLAKELGDDAQDVFQEVCAAVVKAIQDNRIEHPQFVLAYAHGVSERIKNRFIEGNGKYRGKVISIDDPSGHVSFVHFACPATQEDDAIRKDTLRTIWAARESLPEIDRQIIQRACFDDEDPQTIAEALGLTRSQLSVRKSRAIAFLKAEYERLTRRTELMAA